MVGDYPRHQFQVRSFLTLPRNFELDAGLYRVAGQVNQQIPGYTRLDARLGWRLGESVEMSAGVQNLLDGRHAEFNGIDVFVTPSQVKRSAYGKLTWRF